MNRYVRWPSRLAASGLLALLGGVPTHNLTRPYLGALTGTEASSGFLCEN